MVYIPHTKKDIQAMLEVCGVNSLDDLFEDIPKNLPKFSAEIPQLSEMEIIKHLQSLSNKNLNTNDFLYFIGAGAYDRFIPAAVKYVVFRSEFYTAYTPYQPEMSQGTLQAIFEFQSIICELTAMEVANASLYDGATSCAESLLLALRNFDYKKNKVLIAKSLNPRFYEVCKTYLSDFKVEVQEVNYNEKGQVDIQDLKNKLNTNTACFLFAYPNFLGIIEDGKSICEIVKASGALAICCVDPFALNLLLPPGEFGADVVCGEAQSLGLPLSFGGPYLGIFAAKKQFIRKMPGRIVGKTTDRNGKVGFVLTFQAREQHIRREKATSNICSNQNLCALWVTVYATLAGKNGLYQLAYQTTQKAHYLFTEIKKLNNYEIIFNSPFFCEFVFKPKNKSAEEVLNILEKEKIIGGLNLTEYFTELKDCILICVTEKRTKEEINKLVECLKKI